MQILATLLLLFDEYFLEARASDLSSGLGLVSLYALCKKLSGVQGRALVVIFGFPHFCEVSGFQDFAKFRPKINLLSFGDGFSTPNAHPMPAQLAQVTRRAPSSQVHRALRVIRGGQRAS